MARDEEHSTAGRIPLSGEQEDGRSERAFRGHIGRHQDRIDLNSASEGELARMAGIGVDRARRIVEYRERHRGFQSIEDLANVSGFGEKMVEDLRGQFEVGRPFRPPLAEEHRK